MIIVFSPTLTNNIPNSRLKGKRQEGNILIGGVTCLHVILRSSSFPGHLADVVASLFQDVFLHLICDSDPCIATCTAGVSLKGRLTVGVAVLFCSFTTLD